MIFKVGVRKCPWAKGEIITWKFMRYSRLDGDDRMGFLVMIKK